MISFSFNEKEMIPIMRTWETITAWHFLILLRIFRRPFPRYYLRLLIECSRWIKILEHLALTALETRCFRSHVQVCWVEFATILLYFPMFLRDHLRKSHHKQYSHGCERCPSGLSKNWYNVIKSV